MMKCILDISGGTSDGGPWMPSFFARRSRMMRLYVSFCGMVMAYARTPQNRINHCVHRQFLFIATYPPRAGPRAGPRNGAMRNIELATARWIGDQRSEFEPAPTASVPEPTIPAKNRRITSPANEFVNPAPMVNSSDGRKNHRYTARRPQFSDIGADTVGPNPNPSTYTVSGSRATVRLTPKCFATSGTPMEYQ